MTNHSRLRRLEQRLLPPSAVCAADARMQARICAGIACLLTGAPTPPYTPAVGADWATVAAWAHQHGQVDPPAADAPASIESVLDWLANWATVPERIPVGYQLADWANAHDAAGRDPAAELERLRVARAATGNIGEAT